MENKFSSDYQKLILEMQKLAASDKSVFLPNVEPQKKANFILICMEPSIGHWARSNSEFEAKKKVDAGFRNFTSSIEDFILHFCVQKYLCQANHTYHFTDISKGAMTTDCANIDRVSRYKKWHDLLLSEIALVGTPDVKIFSVGGLVAHHLENANFPYTFNKIIHYSSQAGKARLEGIHGQEEYFDKFNGSVTLAHILDAAKKVFDSMPMKSNFRESTLNHLAKSKLTDSRQKLIYIYKRAFESV